MDWNEATGLCAPHPAPRASRGFSRIADRDDSLVAWKLFFRSRLDTCVSHLYSLAGFRFLAAESRSFFPANAFESFGRAARGRFFVARPWGAKRRCPGRGDY